MGMDAGCRVDEVGVPRGQRTCGLGRRAVPTRDEDPIDTGRTGTVQDGVEVVDKGLVLEVSVGIDDPRQPLGNDEAAQDAVAPFDAASVASA